MWGLLHYFNFQGNPANLAPIHTCCAWSDVHKHLPHISKRLGCLFMGLSPEACLKDLGSCRSLWYDRQVRFVMLKYGTVPEEGMACARGDGTRCCGCSRAHGWALSLYYLSSRTVAMSAECPEKWPVTTKLYGKTCTPCALLVGEGVEEYNKGHSVWRGTFGKHGTDRWP